MTSKSKKIFFTILLGSIGSFFLFKRNDAESTLPVVAITQIINHNTLDTVREGLLDGLKSAGWEDGKTIHIVYENANGNVSIASQIASKFIALKPAVIVALSTQSAQILLTSAQKEHIPLVFSAVTDPVSAQLVTNWSKTDAGVTGVSDYMAPEPQIDMIMSFLPNLKKLGLLYNSSEVNSVSFLNSFETIAKQRGIEIVHASAHNTAEAAEAFKSLVGKVDAVFFPNDNTIMAAAPAVAAAALQNNVPLFANDEASVQQGVLAALSFDRPAMGHKTAEMVDGILKGQTTASFKVHNHVHTDVVVNEKTLATLGMEMPSTFPEGTKVLK